MLISNLELIRHIKDEVDFVLQNTIGKTKEEVTDDMILCRAVVRSIEIIGEASKKLSEDFKTAHPGIEWKKIGRTRDKLIHDYFGIDYDIIWDIITGKLPNLQAYVDRLVIEPGK